MARHDYATHHRGRAACALTAPPAAEAQQAAKVARIGWLAKNPAANPRLLEAFGSTGDGAGRRGARSHKYDGRRVSPGARRADAAVQRLGRV
jgi:hypothetical protein